jgi:hypothetical protein
MQRVLTGNILVAPDLLRHLPEEIEKRLPAWEALYPDHFSSAHDFYLQTQKN